MTYLLAQCSKSYNQIRRRFHIFKKCSLFVIKSSSCRYEYKNIEGNLRMQLYLRNRLIFQNISNTNSSNFTTHPLLMEKIY